MAEKGLQPVEPDKRAIPIVQTSGRSAARRGERVRRAGSRRQAGIAFFVVIVVAGLLAGGYFLFAPREQVQTVSDFAVSTVSIRTLQDTVELSGTVAARSEATVTAPESGTMGTLYVAEGEWVTEGQLLAVLETETLGDTLDDEVVQLERQIREYDRFLLQHEYDLRSYDRNRENLAEDLADREEELSESRELYELGSLSLSELEEAQEAVENAIDALDDHDAEVEEALAIHDLNRGNYEDDIQAIRDSITDLEERIAGAKVTSPMTGRIIDISDSAMTAGERITQYQTLMEITDARNPLIVTEIEEQYLSAIDSGTPVAVEISDVSVAGFVERIGLTAQASSDGGAATVELDIAIDVGESEITTGTSTIVEVLVGEVPDAMVLPRGPYLTSGNRMYLYRVNGTTAERVEVTYGTTTDDAVEIVSGVRPGDVIITSSYTHFIEHDSIELGGNE